MLLSQSSRALCSQLKVPRSSAFPASGRSSMFQVSSRSSARWSGWIAGARPLVSPPRPYWQPRLSPDGRRLAVYIEEGKNDVWVCDLAVSTFTRLTFEANNWNPLWTPDGKRVTFQSTRAGAANLFWRAADGSAAEERLTTSPYTHYPHSWEGAGLLREPSHDGIGHLGAPSRWGAQATPFPPNAVS